MYYHESILEVIYKAEQIQANTYLCICHFLCKGSQFFIHIVDIIEK